MPPPKTMMLFVMLGITVVMVLRKKDNSRATALFSQFHGSQKLFAAIAVLAAIVILLNPEFLALGLLGDTAFYDVLVLLLTLQMHTFAVRSFQISRAIASRAPRVIAARLCLSFGVIGLFFAPIGTLLSAMHKNTHQI